MRVTAALALALAVAGASAGAAAFFLASVDPDAGAATASGLAVKAAFSSGIGTESYNPAYAFTAIGLTSLSLRLPERPCDHSTVGIGYLFRFRGS